MTAEGHFGGDPLSDIRALAERLRAAAPWPADAAPRPTDPLATLHEIGPTDDLVEQFSRAASATGMHVHVAAEVQWRGLVVDLLRDAGMGAVVLESNEAAYLRDSDVTRLEQELQAAGIPTTRQRDDETLFSAAASVTGVVAAIAETGTLVCPSGADRARAVTLVPPLHIAVVGRDQIVGDLFEYFARLDEAELPSCINLISGPSKTADIEGILIHGVHGPGVVHIVVI